MIFPPKLRAEKQIFPSHLFYGVLEITAKLSDSTVERAASVAASAASVSTCILIRTWVSGAVQFRLDITEE